MRPKGGIRNNSIPIRSENQIEGMYRKRSPEPTKKRKGRKLKIMRRIRIRSFRVPKIRVMRNSNQERISEKTISR